MTSLAARAEPERVAVIVAFACDDTADVVTVKAAVAVPAGTMTVFGTLAAAASDVSVTLTPPSAATPSRAIVPLAGVPPVTWVGLIASASKRGARTTKEAVVVDVPNVAVIVDVTSQATALVVISALADALPSGTSTNAGAETAAALVDRSTTTPPCGAAVLRVSVAVASLPPTTLGGAMVNDAIVGGGMTRAVIVRMPRPS